MKHSDMNLKVSVPSNGRIRLHVDIGMGQVSQTCKPKLSCRM